jgi:hypothetical protein
MTEKVKQQRRKLKNKDIDAEYLDDYAKRDVEIIFGKDRGKYSMQPHGSANRRAHDSCRRSTNRLQPKTLIGSLLTLVIG